MTLRRHVPTVVAALTLAGSTAAMLLVDPTLRRDPGQLVEVETGYQTIRIVEGVEDGPTPQDAPLRVYTGRRPVPMRYFRFDEDATSYQSVVVLEDEPDRLTLGRYYDHLALGAWFSGMPWTRAAGDPRVLLVGYCGGTLHRVLGHVAPEGRDGPDVLGVELDPDVVTLARERLAPLPTRLTLRTGEDGRAVVESLGADDTFDLVYVDAYARTQYVPFQVASLEFFRACVRHLAPTGAVGVNVNASAGLSGRLLRHLASTLAEALGPEGSVWLAPNRLYGGSATIWGVRSRVAPRLGAVVPAALSVPAYLFDRLLVRHVPRPGETLTDDRAPTERLADEVLREPEAR